MQSLVAGKLNQSASPCRLPCLERERLRVGKQRSTDVMSVQIRRLLSHAATNHPLAIALRAQPVVGCWGPGGDGGVAGSGS